MRACAESLIAALGDTGPIYMYTPYERTVINGLIRLFPDLEEPLKAITGRLYDLHPVTKHNYYHPDMHGSWSIKAVLPTVAPELRHDDLDIVSNGAMAEPVFLESINKETTTERSEELREALLRYCKLDTEAMVRLAHYLEGRA
jgi:predicted RecB family nuclease